MRILHYGLGFPPYRTGGLTKYCVDLMLIQKNMGHDVAMMWPGKLGFSGHFVHIKTTINKIGVKSFEIVNPLPVSLDEGIKDIKEYTKKCSNPRIFKDFFDEYKPDVLHIHTFMGLYREVLEEAKNLGIKLVFTTHDYFGICPKVTLFRNNQICDGDCGKCEKCNERALSIKKIKILQSPLYRGLKDTKVVKKLRTSHRKDFFDNGFSEGENCGNRQKNQYEELRNYYVSFFEFIDMVHFNSSTTEEVYRKYIPLSVKGKVINITHGKIADNRRKKEFNEDLLKIVYLAPAKPFKGYIILREALDELWNEGIDCFKLTMYNNSNDIREYMDVKHSFKDEDLEKIFEKSDVLIMPSVWKETYGFTVLEALSYGVPVIISENVGAKDLVGNNQYGMVIEPTKDGVKRAIIKLINNRDILKEYNNKIVNEMDFEGILRSPYDIEKLYEDIRRI